eukprot:COSAG05_NODE_6495_length_947_cov_0.728774_2_plen_99_part_01
MYQVAVGLKHGAKVSLNTGEVAFVCAMPWVSKQEKEELEQAKLAKQAKAKETKEAKGAEEKEKQAKKDAKEKEKQAKKEAKAAGLGQVPQHAACASNTN